MLELSFYEQSTRMTRPKCAMRENPETPTLDVNGIKMSGRYVKGAGWAAAPTAPAATIPSRINAFGDRLFRVPGYPAFLAGLYAVGGPRVGLVQAAQALLGALACMALMLAARKLWGEPVAGI